LRRKKFSHKPSIPPEGMMYDHGGNLISIELMEIACQMLMIGSGKENKSHWSRDPDYFLADKVRKNNGRI
jgi:hypothetical protein